MISYRNGQLSSENLRASAEAAVADQLPPGAHPADLHDRAMTPPSPAFVATSPSPTTASGLSRTPSPSGRMLGVPPAQHIHQHKMGQKRIENGADTPVSSEETPANTVTLLVPPKRLPQEGRPKEVVTTKSEVIRPIPTPTGKYRFRYVFSVIQRSDAPLVWATAPKISKSAAQSPMAY